MNLSYWEYDQYFSKADVLVIGSGIVGLHAALHLKELDPSLTILVAERGVLPSGASTKNAGFACFGSLTELIDDLSQTDTDTVWELVSQRWRGLQFLRNTWGEVAMGYEPLGGHEVFTPEDQHSFEACMDRRQEINRILADITGEKEVFRLNDAQIKHAGLAGISHLISNVAEGQINTGQLMRTLIRAAQAEGITLLNGLSIQEIHPDPTCTKVITSQGWELSFPKVLVATNGFTRQLLPELAVKPARNQVLITKPIKDLPLKGAYHYDRGYVYFRDLHDRVLIGGARNLDPMGETTDTFGETEIIQTRLMELLQTVILLDTSVEIERSWSGILGVGTIKSPIIRNITPSLTVAVRLGGMGVAIGAEVGRAGAKSLY